MNIYVKNLKVSKSNKYGITNSKSWYFSIEFIILPVFFENSSQSNLSQDSIQLDL